MWQVNFHQGNNLKSFPYFSMQDDFTGNAYTPIGEMFPNVYPYTLITEVKGESTAATRLPTGPNAGEWVGSLQTIDVDKGYWVMSQQDITLEFELIVDSQFMKTASWIRSLVGAPPATQTRS